jgi:hypothetical protein
VHNNYALHNTVKNLCKVCHQNVMLPLPVNV